MFVGNWIVAQSNGPPAKPREIRRAQPPDFSKQPDSIFFRDVFTEGLEGERPADLGVAPAAVATTSGTPGSSGTGSDAGAGAGSGWSKVVAASALEDEIKAIKLKLEQEITTPTQFASTGHKAARREFSVAAAVFGIIAEYDGDVRWKDSAPGVRDLFSRGAANAKVSTPQAYNESKLRLQDLTDLVAGSSLSTAGDSERVTDWSKTCDRSPLMQRMEAAQQGKLQIMTASADEFKSNGETITHEANVLGALAEILQREGMPDADADDYAGWAKQIVSATGEIREAVKSNNYDQARQAVGVISQQCSQCHELYR
jgi:cytochrome c556